MIHGGDVYRNQILLDFSVNINPFGIPEKMEEALHLAVRDCVQYPDPKQEQLCLALAEYEQVKPEEILCGNGVSELLLALAHTICPVQAALPIPSFFGYERSLSTVNAKINYYEMTEETQFSLDESFLMKFKEENDVLYLANPNNPTGKLVSVKLLEQIILQCERNQIYVVLDECFLPFCERSEEYHALFHKRSYPYLIRLHAFTKTFAIPGVRLGYMICDNQEFLKRVEEHLPEWNLSIFAQRVGMVAVKEQEFLKKSCVEIRKERKWLSEQLTKSGFEVISGDANFILLKTQFPLYEMLRARNILIRDCSNFKGLKEGYFRIAVKQHKENEQLIRIIKEEAEAFGN